MRRWAHYIYVLCDPRDGAVRYVGSTNNPQTRIALHVAQLRRGQGSRQMQEWFNELRGCALGPILVVVHATNANRYRIERELYRRCSRDGCRLLNTQFGGGSYRQRVANSRPKGMVFDGTTAEAVADMQMVAAVFAAESFRSAEVRA